ncbi:MAG: hypothetical protein ACXV2B_02780, partial [Halobacteriota archaeon]
VHFYSVRRDWRNQGIRKRLAWAKESQKEEECSTGLHDRPLHYPGLRTQSDCLTQHSLLAKYR